MVVGAADDVVAGKVRNPLYKVPLLLFHQFHPAHMLFSGAATTAMFCRYEHRYFKGMVVGLLGSIGVCGISDVFIPYLSLWVLGEQPHFHVCIIQEPGLVLPFALVGVLIGVGASMGVSRSTLFSHPLHVFVSTMASIFYLVMTMGMIAWIDKLGAVFFFVLIAVVGPCCFSDIVFPLWMSKSARLAYQQEEHHTD